MTGVRSALFVVWMYGLMVVLGTLFAPTLLLPRGAAKAPFALWRALVFGGLKVICGLDYEVRGTSPAGGALVCSKHHSMFETIALWSILPDPAIVLKKELAKLPFFGWYAVKLGNIVLDREGGAKALRAMTEAAKAKIAEGRQIVLFPEGTRQAPGAPPDYKPGAAGLYAALGAPVVPVALNSGLYWPAHGILRRPGRIVVEFLEPIEPGLPRAAFMRTLEARIEAASNALLPPDLRPAAAVSQPPPAAEAAA